MQGSTKNNSNAQTHNVKFSIHERGNAVATIFTKILNEHIPGVKIYQDELVFAFMDSGQINPGHVLVATTHPYETLMDTDEASAEALMRLARRVALAVEEAFRPDGITLLQANRPAGWQTVPHVHIHVLPRYENDDAGLIWPRKEPGIEAMKEYASRIKLM